MKIGAVGYNYVHNMSNEHFVMNRPQGQGAPVLLIIKTPALFSVNGNDYTVKPGSVILLRAKTPCRYTTDDDNYTDDWVFFDENEWDEEYFHRLGIPLDIPVHLGNTEELSQIVHILSFEHWGSDMYHEEIERRYIDILFLTLSRIIETGNTIHSKSYSEKNYRLAQLRTEIFTMPDLVGSIDDMAQKVQMSRSGLQHMYKKMFGNSIINDVISSRVQLAVKLLVATNMTVKEIALQCGYSNEYSFMRQFRQRTGKTPTDYRRSL